MSKFIISLVALAYILGSVYACNSSDCSVCSDESTCNAALGCSYNVSTSACAASPDSYRDCTHFNNTP